MYYMMYPSLYVAPNFFKSRKEHWELPETKFASLSDAVSVAKLTHVCLREQNWYVYECGWISKTRLSLRTLYERGYFSQEISCDSHGSYYNWKND